MVKNYKLGLISVLVSCSLSNAMDSQDSDSTSEYLRDVAVVFRNKKFLDVWSLFSSPELTKYYNFIVSGCCNSHYKVKQEIARQAYCKEIECSDNDCAKFLGFLVSFFDAADDDEPTNYRKLLFTGDIDTRGLHINHPKSLPEGCMVRYGNVYNKFCSNCRKYGFLGFRLENIKYMKNSLIEKKKTKILKM